ncbi:ABC transporter substrate-binding protein [Roseomonas xinghualingensis]|uniref:ABC transporter substrate-binding protein n=1 Tax=Roseomonas xinghualingensis TaxID=2986475 RepID=UPI0021F1DB4A|nr:ABC transporter substrate-binding protein [Roseomonas sp. SXEYE001]MCV4206979.1 ABC transporter substrate-binding protein [Roseomonas sp. SXEYE001]
MTYRRSFLRASAAMGTMAGLGAPLARPALAKPASALKFIPQADLTLLDPIQTTAAVTRNHGLMVFDTLYGVDEALNPQPQMVEGHRVEEDGRRWTLTLREGLVFHDGTPVLARDAVASIRRWGSRDAYGQSLMAVVDELSAPDDRTIVFRLKRPWRLLPNALAKPGPSICAIMPERLARTEATVQVTEMVGSGPFRFIAGERVSGARAVYERFEGYVPRPGGAASFTAGPKQVHLDRVEWHTIPDASTAAAAMQSGEMDWWEQPSFDLLPLLRRSRDIAIEAQDAFGTQCILRFNTLMPPFDKPEARRAFLGAIQQSDFMAAVVGDDRKMWADKVGFFAPGSVMANDEGMAALNGPRDIAAAKRALEAAGYKGERVVMPAPTDFPTINAMSEVAADMFRRMGINLDYQPMDWGSVIQRLSSRQPVEKGGWSAFCIWVPGITAVDPAAHTYLRGTGERTTFGWPSAPGVERLREAWIDAPDLESQKRIARELQAEAFRELPYLPLGTFYQQTAYHRRISGVLKGQPLFYNVRKD